MKKLLAGVVTLVAATCAAVMFAPPVSAAGASCGPGYRFLKSYPLKGLDNGVTGGYVSVYYNDSTGKNCAIAKPISAWSGKVSHLEVQLSANSYAGYVQDGQEKDYHYYAGPIYIPARGECITANGVFDYRGERYAGTARDKHCR